MHNVGDDAILCALVKGLRARGHSDLTVLSFDPVFTSRKFQVDTLPEFRLNPLRAIWAIWHSDILIIGGGGLLQDIGKNYIFLLLKTMIAKLSSSNVIICAVGVSPLYTRLGIWITRSIVNLADLVTVRDSESLYLLKSIGIRRKVHVTGDLVLTLPNPDPIEGEKTLKDVGISTSSNQKLIGISLRPWFLPQHYRNGEEIFSCFLGKFADGINKVINLYDVKLVILPFYYKQDRKVGEALLSMVNNSDETCVFCDRELDHFEIAGIIANLDMLIGMRLHSIIFASMSGIPSISISYLSKVSSYMKQINCTEWDIPIAAFESNLLVEKTSDILVDLKSAGTNVRENFERIRRNSMENFVILDELLAAHLCDNARFL